MITQFPKIYPDELLYSQLARYHVRSGNLAYIFTAEQLFQTKTVRPDVEFLNSYTQDTLSVITSTMSLADVIMKHTMFPYYGRFLKLERRMRAYDSLVAMRTDYRKHLPIPLNRDGGRRYLRYCPVCAQNDRKEYGETYWHRIHQMVGIDICPMHHCYLIDSDIATDSTASPSLVAAEEAAISEKTVYSNNPVECNLAVYIAEVFNSDLDLQTEATAGKFLHYCLTNTKYMSKHGKLRNMELVYMDFTEFYKEFPNPKFNQQWQIGKVFSDSRHSIIEICMVAMFLGVPAKRLVEMDLSDSSSAVCKEIVRVNRHGGQKKYDWNAKDIDTLPKVKEVISDLLQVSNKRPVKISIGMVERLLGMPKSGLRNYPLCRAEIMKYTESQEQYWARELVWAANTMLARSGVVHMTGLMKLTNMRVKNITASIPYLDDSPVAEIIKAVAQ